MKRYTGTLLMIFCCAGFAQGRTLYVDSATGSDSSDGLTGQTAKKTIQAAVNAAGDGSTIHVGPGVYEPFSTSNLVMTIIGDAGAAATIVDGGGTNRCAELLLNEKGASYAGDDYTTNSVLRNLTLTGGSAKYGAGVLGGVLYDCIVTNCTATEGGGGCCHVYVRNSKIVCNTAHLGGGTYLCSSRDSLILGNYATFMGGGLYKGSARNCRVESNTACYHGGGFSASFYCCLLLRNVCSGNSSSNAGAGAASDSTLYFCTLVGNEGSEAGGVDNCTVQNCLFYGNTCEKGISYASIYRSYGAYNCYPAGTRIDGSLGSLTDSREYAQSETPGFVDVEEGDYRLLPGSIGIDIGPTSISSSLYPTVDMVGNVRFANNAYDCGAYEYQAGTRLFTPNLSGHGTCSPRHEFYAPGGTATFTAVELDRRFIGWSTNGTDIVSTDPVWTFRDDGTQTNLTAHFQRTVYIDAENGDDANDAFAEDRPRKTLAGFTLYSGETFYLAPGSYGGFSANVEGLTVIGTAGAEKTFVYGINVSGGTDYGRSNVFRGLTLLGSRYRTYAYDYRRAATGGTYVDCIISNGNVTASGSPLNITEKHGGGACHATLIGCRVLDNHASGCGGGCYDCVLTNCIVSGNSSDANGGGCYACDISYSTVCDNSAAAANEAYECLIGDSIAWSPDGADPTLNSTIRNCCTVDPRIVSWYYRDFRLRTGSSCIDAGTACESLPAQDVRGEARVQGSAPDIGAIEGGVAGSVVETRTIGYGDVSPHYAVFDEGEVVFQSIVDERPFRGFFIEPMRTFSTDSTLTWRASDGDALLTCHFSTNIYVDAANGEGGASGEEPDEAVRTLAEGVALIKDGETLCVAAGKYDGVSLPDKTFRAVASDGPLVTIIDGGNTNRCLTGHGSLKATFVGFTLANGRCYPGSSWTTAFGGGVDYAQLDRCIVTNCLSRDYGGGVSHSSCRNCLFYGNTANRGGGASDSTLVNCTFLANRAWKEGSAIYDGIVTNTIVCRRSSDESVSAYSSSRTACMLGDDAGVVNVASGDARLRFGSPALDAAILVDVGEFDLYGNPRQQGDGLDIGAVEGAVPGRVVDVDCTGHGANDAIGKYFITTEEEPTVISGIATNRLFIGFSTNGSDIVSSDPTFTWLPSYGHGRLTLHYATNLYVDASAPAGGNGLTRGTAFRTLADAVSIARDGESVRVAPGAYGIVTCPSYDYSVIAEKGPLETFINSNVSGKYGVTCTKYSYQPMFAGFTIGTTVANVYAGGTYYGTFCGCIITNCYPETFDNTVYGSTLESCLVTGCRSNHDFDYVAEQSCMINCTVVGNRYGQNRDFPLGCSYCRMTNCIVEEARSYLQYTNTVVMADVAGMVARDLGDFRLRDDSPLLDAAVAFPPLRWPYDAYGNPRCQGAAVDVGALEGGSPDRALRVNTVGAGALVGTSAVVRAGTAYEVAAVQTVRPFLGWSTNGAEIASVEPRFVVSNLTDDVSLTARFATNLYVAVGGSGEGFRPDDPLPSISSAVDIACAGERIYIAAGRYEPFSTDGRALEIVGVGPEATVVDGGGTSRCVTVSQNSGETGPLIRNLTLVNGNAVNKNGGGIYKGCLENVVITNCTAASGGGAAWATLTNCVVVGNIAKKHGGGLYQADAESCLIVGNVATNSGGGIYSSYSTSGDEYTTDAQISGCVVFGNSASCGGGIYGAHSLNCTVVSNVASSGAACYAGYHVRDIFWRNVNRNGQSGPDAEFVYTNLYSSFSTSGVGISPVAGNDPKFVSLEHRDFRLLPDSPCIDAGISYDDDDTPLLSMALPACDMGGKPRLVGTRYDLGAYEGATYGRSVQIAAEGRGKTMKDWIFAELDTPVTLSAIETVRPCLGWRIDDGPIQLTGPTLTTCFETTGASVATAVFSTNVYADASRPDDSGDGLTRTTAKRTLAAAQALAYEDESVIVLPGDYASPGAARPIGYIGEGGHSNVVVTGDFAGVRDGTRVTGFTFADAAVSGGSFAECLFNEASVSNAALTRCTVWGTASDSILDRSLVWHDTTPDPQPSTSNLQPSTSYLADPTFADPEEGDFRVAVDSPCVSNGVAWCGVERIPVDYPSAPVVTPGDGFLFETNCTVEIAGDAPKARIWFATDGNTPLLTDAFLFTDPFVVSNTVTICAVQKVGRLMSPCTTVTLTFVRGDLRRGADCTNLIFTTSGDAEFACIDGDVLSLKSGKIGANGSSTLATSVTGGGVLSFAWSCDCESDPAGACAFDCLALYVDGERVAAIDGATEWTNVTYRLRGKGTHAVSWVFAKNGSDDPLATVGDWGALRTVGWRTILTLPELALDAPAADLAEALEPFADVRVRNRITGLSDYTRLRNWALGVCDEMGIDEDSLVEHPCVWHSFALDQPGLLAAEPTTDDLRVDGFTSASGTCRLVVSLDGLSIGDGATSADLAEVFGLEGSSSLNANGFSAENLEISLAEPVDGKAAFTIAPKGSPSSFFIKTDVKP